MSRSGVQNKKRMVVMKPRIPVAIALHKIPLAATTLGEVKQKHHYDDQKAYLAFLVSSAICPEASKPVKVPAVNRLEECQAIG